MPAISDMYDFGDGRWAMGDGGRPVERLITAHRRSPIAHKINHARSLRRAHPDGVVTRLSHRVRRDRYRHARADGAGGVAVETHGGCALPPAPVSYTHLRA